VRDLGAVPAVVIAVVSDVEERDAVESSTTTTTSTSTPRVGRRALNRSGMVFHGKGRSG
jgi:hypothetical protein